MNHHDLYQRIERGDDLAAVDAWASRTLADIAGGRLAVRAVRHPLGFLCLPVERTGTNGTCLHVWNVDAAPAEPTTSNVHAHSWDLLSYVLFGEVHNEIVQIAEDGVAPTSRIFEVRSRGQVDELHATATLVRHATTAVHAHRAGESYTLPAGHFHTTVVPPGQATATVALGRGRRDGRDLSLGPIDRSTHWIRRQSCGEDETIQVVKTVADRAIARLAPHDGG